MSDQVVNAADESQVSKAKYKEKHRRERELNDVRFILSSVQGRRFIWRLLEEGGIFKSSFVGQFQTFFLEGMRNLALKILADIHEAEPEAYSKMLKENNESRN